MLVRGLKSEKPATWRPLVVFVHIPRTGGGSATSAISHAYGRVKSAGNVQLSDEKSHRLLGNIAANPEAWSGRALADHVPYGLFARYLPADTRYITFLRDPVERVLSHYHFHARAGDEKLRATWRQDPALAGEIRPDDEVSLEAGLERGLTIYNNFATRFLYGGETLEPLPPDALERAKANLDRFSFVGVTERLDESLVLLGRVLGVPLAGYHLRHVTERPKADAFPDTLIRQIEQHNALDIELYRIARERFDAAADAAGDLAAEVEQLTQQRAEVTDQAEAARVARKTFGKAQRQIVKRAKRARVDEVPIAELGVEELQTELLLARDRLRTLKAALAAAGGEEPRAKAKKKTKSRKKPAPKLLQLLRRPQRPKHGAGGGEPAGAEPIEPAPDQEPRDESPPVAHSADTTA